MIHIRRNGRAIKILSALSVKRFLQIRLKRPIQIILEVAWHYASGYSAFETSVKVFEKMICRQCRKISAPVRKRFESYLRFNKSDQIFYGVALVVRPTSRRASDICHWTVCSIRTAFLNCVETWGQRTAILFHFKYRIYRRGASMAVTRLCVDRQ